MIALVGVGDHRDFGGTHVAVEPERRRERAVQRDFVQERGLLRVRRVDEVQVDRAHDAVVAGKEARAGAQVRKLRRAFHRAETDVDRRLFVVRTDAKISGRSAGSVPSANSPLRRERSAGASGSSATLSGSTPCAVLTTSTSTAPPSSTAMSYAAAIRSRTCMSPCSGSTNGWSGATVATTLSRRRRFAQEVRGCAVAGAEILRRRRCGRAGERDARTMRRAREARARTCALPSSRRGTDRCAPGARPLPA